MSDDIEAIKKIFEKNHIGGSEDILQIDSISINALSILEEIGKILYK